MRIVVAPDKFKGTLSAAQVCSAVAPGLTREGHHIDAIALSDGGEGLVDVFGGANKITTVTGPLGEPVKAAWRFDGTQAVMEMSAAAGLALIGGAEHNDPLAASTQGVGELITAAMELGARKILLGVGGSATTDGGLGAIGTLNVARLRAVDLTIACDVETTFVDAAATFGPQKGATAAQVKLLQRRLESLARTYENDFGRDVTELLGSGAAGGLAGGLAAIGATLTSGFDAVSEHVDLYERLCESTAVITGEGRLDATSFDGKVVGGVLELAAELKLDVLVVAGSVDNEALAALDPTVSDRLDSRRVTVVSLTQHFGEDAAFDHTGQCLSDAVNDWVAGLPG